MLSFYSNLPYIQSSNLLLRATMICFSKKYKRMFYQTFCVSNLPVMNFFVCLFCSGFLIMIFWPGLLGSMAPCVLYGSNVERLGSAPGTFANHCLPYSGLYLIGTFFFGCNFLAQWFSYPTRTAIRRKFNLEASNSYLSS